MWAYVSLLLLLMLLLLFASSYDLELWSSSWIKKSEEKEKGKKKRFSETYPASIFKYKSRAVTVDSYSIWCVHCCRPERERERSALTNTKPLVFSSVTLTSTKEKKKIIVIVCSEWLWQFIVDDSRVLFYGQTNFGKLTLVRPVLMLSTYPLSEAIFLAFPMHHLEIQSTSWVSIHPWSSLAHRHLSKYTCPYLIGVPTSMLFA